MSKSILTYLRHSSLGGAFRRRKPRPCCERPDEVSPASHTQSAITNKHNKTAAVERNASPQSPPKIPKVVVIIIKWLLLISESTVMWIQQHWPGSTFLFFFVFFLFISRVWIGGDDSDERLGRGERCGNGLFPNETPTYRRAEALGGCVRRRRPRPCCDSQVKRISILFTAEK